MDPVVTTMIAVASSGSDIDFVPAAPRAQLQAKFGGATTAAAAGRDGLPMVLLFTFVLWSGLLTVGLVGLLIEPARILRRPVTPPVVKAELLTVELTPEPVLLPEAGSPPPPAEPPPLLRPIDEPPLLALTVVAAPDAAVAFALPVEGPVRIVSAAQASFARVAEAEPAPAAASLPVQAMVYGQGEGRQEAPEYPRQAKRERQEGAVGVKFSVGQNGRVVEAALSSPSPWPLLNEAALKVIQDRWRFRAGDLRLYEVSIRFELKR